MVPSQLNSRLGFSNPGYSRVDISENGRAVFEPGNQLAFCPHITLRDNLQINIYHIVLIRLFTIVYIHIVGTCTT